MRRNPSSRFRPVFPPLSLMGPFIVAALIVVAGCQSPDDEVATLITSVTTTEAPPPTTTTASPADPDSTPSTTSVPSTTVAPSTTTLPSETPPSTTAPAAPPENVSAIDWWGCWRAEDALDGGGNTPSDGSVVATLPNCASGPADVGRAGDMSHPSAPPIFRTDGASGRPAIEFTFAGDTLLQTNAGDPWEGDDLLPASTEGITVAWIGMMTDVASHDVKYLVSGLDMSNDYPMLIVEGEGPDRFAGYGGGSTEIRSPDGTVVDLELHGVILHLAPDGTNSTIEVDGVVGDTPQDSAMGRDVTGITLGNHFGRGFSTTDHQFVFLGLHRGTLSEADKVAFWDHLDQLRSG